MKAPGADAAHPHHLAGHVDDLELLQQPALIIAQGGPVGAELLMEHPLDLVAGQAVGGFQVPHRDHDRWLADDPVPAVDQLAELGQRLQAVMGVRLGGHLLGVLLGPPGRLGLLLGLGGLGGVAHRLQELLLGQMRIPDLQPPHLGEAGHRLPIGRHRRQRHRPGVDLAEAVVTARDREAGRQPLHVVLERPREGLVEIVQAEQQLPLGRGEQRRSSTDAHRHTAGPAGRRWGCLQVGGHDLGRAPVEGERRDQHAPVPDRDQVGLPGAILLLEQPDRVGPVSGRHPAGVAGQRRPVARLRAPRSAVVDARVRDPLDGHRLRPGLDGHRLRPYVPLGPAWPPLKDINQVPASS